MRRIVASFALLALVVGAASAAYAGNCEGCGRPCGQPHCRLVCEMKKVVEVEYDVKCEDFCVPGKSQKCGCKWYPTCGCVRTKRVLVKHEVTKEVPVYKCVVEYCCPHCAAKDGLHEMVLGDANEATEALISDTSATAQLAQPGFRR